MKTQLQLAQETLLEIAKKYIDCQYKNVDEVISDMSPLYDWVSESVELYEKEPISTCCGKEIDVMGMCTDCKDHTTPDEDMLIIEQTGLSNNFN